MTILCFGVFDGLRAEHVSYLEQARNLGDRVVVLVARDTRALATHGQLPGMNEQDRLRAVLSHPWVQEARLFQEAEELTNHVKKISPDLVLVGDELSDLVEEWSVPLKQAAPFVGTTNALSLSSSHAVITVEDEDYLPV